MVTTSAQLDRLGLALPQYQYYEMSSLKNKNKLVVIVISVYHNRMKENHKNKQTINYHKKYGQFN